MKFVIIGSSAAGISALKTIRSHDRDVEITLISADAGYYSRCQLHLIAVGQRTEQQAHLLKEGWEKEFNVNFIPNSRVVSLSPETKEIILADKSRHSYDKLLIATGSRTFFPPIKGIEGPGIFGLRNLEDAVELKKTIAHDSSYAIVGAGLVGVELALELAELGKKVSVIEMASIPLPMQLESETGTLCAEIMEKSGIDLLCGEMAEEVRRNADGKPTGLKLKSGKIVEAEIIVCAAGVRSNMEFATEAGIKAGRGIIINHRCETSIKDIFAAGDVAETMDTLLKQVIPSAIWPVAVRQGKTAAINMLGREAELERNTGFKASVVIHKTPVISLGPIYKIEPSWEKKAFRYTAADGKYVVKIFLVSDGQLKAAVLWGDITNAGLYFESIVNERKIDGDIPYLDQLDAAKRGTEQLQVL